MKKAWSNSLKRRMNQQMTSKKKAKAVIQKTDAASTSQFQVRSGIPIPAVQRSRPSLYPWATMEHGDSIFVPLGEEEAKTVIRRLYTSGNSFCRKHRTDCRVVVRAEGDGVGAWIAER